MNTFSFGDYYTGERNAGVALLLLGIAIGTASFWTVRARGQLAAAAWPMALGALLEVAWGSWMAFSAQRSLAHLPAANAEATATLAATLARQVGSYRVATLVELGVVVGVALLSFGIPKMNTARALLLGLLIQSVAFLCNDTFGLSRTMQRMGQIRAGAVAAPSEPGESGK